MRLLDAFLGRHAPVNVHPSAMEKLRDPGTLDAVLNGSLGGGSIASTRNRIASSRKSACATSRNSLRREPVSTKKPVKKSPTLEQVGKVAPHLFFVKHGGKAVKNPHYVPAAKRKKAK